MKNVAVIGAGAYGSYIIDSLLRKHPDWHITLFDVGQKGVKSEAEIGYFSQLKRGLYRGLTDGRFFGFGGASDKWGGQLLTYTENDFAHPDPFMQDVIALDKEGRDAMLAKFKIRNPYAERHVTDRLFTKTGVWLSALHRNFFFWFRIHRRRQVSVMARCRVARLESRDGKKIDAVVYIENGETNRATYDFYFLTAGAFESARILLSSGMVSTGKVPFGDHLSMKVFKIRKSTKIGDEDFIFKMKGTSLITKRLIGEINDVSFYVHPVFNLKFPFFQAVKEVLFKRHFEWKYVWMALRDIPHVIAFTWAVLVRRQMYVLNNEWFLYIDIENTSPDNYVSLSSQSDSFGLPGLDVCYEMGEEAKQIFGEARRIATAYLQDCHVDFEDVSEEISSQTCEDIYHPYRMYDFKDVQDYFTRWDNMLVVNTGCLSRIGGINPTGAMLPVVDHFIQRCL